MANLQPKCIIRIFLSFFFPPLFLINLFPIPRRKIGRIQDMLTCNVAVTAELQAGHDCSCWGPLPQPEQRQRCRHGKSSTHDSLSPHILHRLSPLTSSALSRASASSPAPLLPQHDSASSSTAAATAEIRSSPPPTCWRTCSRLVRRELAVASFVCAKSLHSWFST